MTIVSDRMLKLWGNLTRFLIRFKVFGHNILQMIYVDVVGIWMIILIPPTNHLDDIMNRLFLMVAE